VANPANEDDRRLLPLDEAAQEFFGQQSGITGKTLAHLSRQGRLRTRKIARRLFTTRADLDAMVAASPGATSRPPSPPIRRADAPSHGSSIAMRAIERL
jgi:hypothetical protein